MERRRRWKQQQAVRQQREVCSARMLAVDWRVGCIGATNSWAAVRRVLLPQLLATDCSVGTRGHQYGGSLNRELRATLQMKQGGYLLTTEVCLSVANIFIPNRHYIKEADQWGGCVH